MSGTSERLLERNEETAYQMKENEINSIRSQLPKPGTLGPEDCQECGNDIPMGRRQHGFDLCVGCATVREVKRA
ncbi:hypothetical protein [Marinobacter phage PS6]|nr:hypothetical protein [Marinobacter phage PS6]